MALVSWQDPPQLCHNMAEKQKGKWPCAEGARQQERFRGGARFAFNNLLLHKFAQEQEQTL